MNNSGWTRYFPKHSIGKVFRGSLKLILFDHSFSLEFIFRSEDFGGKESFLVRREMFDENAFGRSFGKRNIFGAIRNMRSVFFE